jgi:hypothetical protein
MGWTVCANCKGRGKTGCPPLLYATIERRPKRGRSTEGRGDGDGDDRDADAISADGSCDGVMIANDGPPTTEGGRPAYVRRPFAVDPEAELLQGVRG